MAFSNESMFQSEIASDAAALDRRERVIDALWDWSCAAGVGFCVAATLWLAALAWPAL